MYPLEYVQAHFLERSPFSATTPHHSISCQLSHPGHAVFEGAHIRDGMRAAPGAIERVQIKNGQSKIYTIGEKPPVGICGSGILDAVAELLKDGIIDHRGAFQEGAPNVREGISTQYKEFLLVPSEYTGHGKDIVVTRSDVNEIQLAKGAIRAGLEILLEEGGIAAGDIDEFIIAGAFGTYLDVGSAMTVGKFPELPRERFRQVGNAAGTGAQQMLLSAERRRVADEIPERVEYIELTTHAGFENTFMKAMFLELYKASLPHIFYACLQAVIFSLRSS
ncbi:MAG: ATP-binding protein [Anaerolineales bacterium]|nr:ATP-binding protein [Anaerolineales bacterium]